MSFPHGWYSVKHGQTEFRINAPILQHLTHSYFVNSTIANVRETPLDGVKGISTIDVDWAAVRTAADRDTIAYLKKFAVSVHHDPAAAARSLSEMVESSSKSREKFLDHMGNVQLRNMRAIEQTAELWGAGLSVLKGIQTGCAISLQVGAAVLPKPAAAVATAGLGAMKFVASFSESKSVGMAAFQAGGEVAISVFKIGREFTGAEAVGVAFFEANWTAGMELLQGKEGSEALTQAALKMADPLLGKVLGSLPASSMKRMAYPVVKSFKEIQHPVMTTGKLVNETMKTIVATGADGLLKQMHEEHADHTSHNQSHSVVKQSTVSNQVVLKAAFVNMSKGIGRGW